MRAPDEVDRPPVAQRLLDDILGQTRIRLQLGELLRVGEQRDDAVADQVDGRDVPGQVHEEDRRQDLLLREDVVVLFRHGPSG